MKQSNLTNLVADAWRYGSSSASNGKWRASINTCAVKVWHHGTHMLNITRDGTITPINPGHGSTSDRCGIRKITAGYNGPNGSVGYRELFEEAS